MNLSDFDYSLPESAIAVRPPTTRGTSKLLVLDRQTGSLRDSLYANLADFLRPGDLLVINNTKVLKARLIAQTESGSEREILLLEKHGEQDVHRMKVMYRRKLKPGMILTIGGHQINVEEVLGDGLAVVSSTSNLLELSEQFGNVPLPPYMHREADASDIERYQTVFAKDQGSVAAPTASLNLTDAVLAKIKAKGVEIAELTLHVGLGTFMPIRTDNVQEHVMHKEYFSIPAKTVQAIKTAKAEGRRVIAVGTTVTRTLEYAADMLANDTTIEGEADIFIYPGYSFKVVDVLVTNFHAPHSTVLMMAAAFAGWDNLKAAYQHALRHDYKFLSYGDSMFIQ
jgi:S-adenosylmethionine:tRNA ribosyltransferase-isomerase